MLISTKHTFTTTVKKGSSLVAQTVKNLPAMWETQFPSLGWEDPQEKGKETHSIFAWKILRTEEPGGLQSMGSQRLGHTKKFSVAESFP